MDNCIFCQIVAGKSPFYRVYEDGDFLAFLNHQPREIGHTLLIPKKHYLWIYDYPDFGRYWEKALVITRAMQKALKPLFVTYMTVGIHIPHAHIHIMPRFGKFKILPPVLKLSQKEMTEVADKIYNKI